MKRRSQDLALTDQNRIIAPSAEHGDVGAHAYDSRCANEHALHAPRLAQLFGEHDLSNRRVQLSPIGVSNYLNIQYGKAQLRWLDVLRKQNHAGACCENGHSRHNSIPDSAREIFRLHQPQHSRRLTTRDHQGIYASEVGGGPHRTGVCAQLAEDRAMSRPVALESKNAVLGHKLTILDAKASPPV